jgi:uncharacterized protein (TIGR02996 family)
MAATRDELFQAVCERPWDLAPRLIFADWLAANGQPKWAEFIRMQCENPEHSLGHFHLRQWPLIDGFDPFEAECYTLLPRPAGVHWGHSFRAGFVDLVNFDSPKLFKEHAATAFAAAPVESLGVVGFSGPEIDEVLSSPFLGRVKDLSLLGVSDTALRMLAGCSGLTHVKVLHLDGPYFKGPRFGDIGAGALAASPYFAAVKYLYLDKHRIGDRGALALAESPNLKSVTFLSFGDKETTALSGSVLEKLRTRFEYLNGWPTQGDV